MKLALDTIEVHLHFFDQMQCVALV